MSGVINYSYENFPLPTMMFFVGLVVGGIPMLYGNIKGKKESKQKSNYLIFLITFALVLFMSLSNVIFNTTSVVDLNNMSLGGYLVLFLVGIVAAGTMVIPGISGSLVLMLLGYYYPIISKINELKSFTNLGSNILILGVFGLGVLAGIVIIAKVLELLFKKYTVKTYFGVLGFVIASIFAIPIASTVGDIIIDIPLAVVSLVMMFIGSVISYKLGDR
jgi:putative membrane protein